MPPEIEPSLSKYTDKYILSAGGAVEKQLESFDLKEWADTNVATIVLASDTIGSFTIETKFSPYDKNMESKEQYFFETRVNYSGKEAFSSDITQKATDELAAIYQAGGNFAATKEEALLNHAKIVALIT